MKKLRTLFNIVLSLFSVVASAFFFYLGSVILYNSSNIDSTTLLGVLCMGTGVLIILALACVVDMQVDKQVEAEINIWKGKYHD